MTGNTKTTFYLFLFSHSKSVAETTNMLLHYLFLCQGSTANLFSFSKSTYLSLSIYLSFFLATFSHFLLTNLCLIGSFFAYYPFSCYDVTLYQLLHLSLILMQTFDKVASHFSYTFCSKFYLLFLSFLPNLISFCS